MTTTGATVTPTDLDGLCEAIGRLDAMGPVDRAKAAGALINAAQTLLGAARREAVYEASRARPYRDLADELGVTPAAINVAVTAHLKAQRRAAA